MGTETLPYEFQNNTIPGSVFLSDLPMASPWPPHGDGETKKSCPIDLKLWVYRGHGL